MLNVIRLSLLTKYIPILDQDRGKEMQGNDCNDLMLELYHLFIMVINEINADSICKLKCNYSLTYTILNDLIAVINNPLPFIIIILIVIVFITETCMKKEKYWHKSVRICEFYKSCLSKYIIGSLFILIYLCMTNLCQYIYSYITYCYVKQSYEDLCQTVSINLEKLYDKGKVEPAVRNQLNLLFIYFFYVYYNYNYKHVLTGQVYCVYVCVCVLSILAYVLYVFVWVCARV